MRVSVLSLIILIIFSACSSSKDTSMFNAEEHLQYAMTIYENEDYREAAAEFQTILLQFPGSKVIDQARYYLAMTYFNNEEYILSGWEFSRLVRDIPGSPFVPEAQFMIGESYYQLSPDFSLDQKYTTKCLQEFQAFIELFPLNPKVPEAEIKIAELTEKLARKEYNSAVIYEKMEYYNAAIKYFGQVAEVYHETSFAPPALYRKIQLLIMKERITEASENMHVFIDRYPNDSNIGEIKSLLEKYEEKS